jgi:hypothetical protein
VLTTHHVADIRALYKEGTSQGPLLLDGAEIPVFSTIGRLEGLDGFSHLLHVVEMQAHVGG